MSARGARRPSTLTDAALRQMTGLNRAQFAELLVEIAPAADAARTQRLADEREGAAYVRRRGAGRPPTFPLAGQLIITLIYLRWNIPYRMLAALFDSDKDTINRAVAELTPVLAGVGISRPDGGRIRDTTQLEAALADLAADDRAALIDGSFVPVPRPGGGWDAQKAQYSPHRGRHVNNFTAISDDTGALMWVTGAYPGATHDLTAIADDPAAGALAGSEIAVLADRGYIGIMARLGLAKAYTPIRRRRRDEDLGEGEQEFNTELAHQRVHVEHAIRRLKINKILHGYRRRTRNSLDRTLAACAALATYPA